MIAYLVCLNTRIQQLAAPDGLARELPSNAQQVGLESGGNGSELS
jgi:hypothetical protein